MAQPNTPQKSATPAAQVVTKENYLLLAALLEGNEKTQRVHKKDPHGQAMHTAAEMYANREYVAAYECFKPVYDKVISDMQRIVARNLEFEANKLAKEQRKPLAVAKERIQSLKTYAQQVIDQLDRLRNDLESKALVRHHLKKQGSTDSAAATSPEEAPPTILNSASETRLDSHLLPAAELISGTQHYMKAPYSPPEIGSLYCVRDKARGVRIIRVTGKSPDNMTVQVVTIEDGTSSSQSIQVSVDSLARQAARGWCSELLPISDDDQEPIETVGQSAPADASVAIGNATMRLDIQNFGRCCADIVRANIKFDTQRIKDVGDGPFRAGDYEHAFLTFEQFTTGFNSAVAASRRAIADGRRALTADKGKLSGKEIQDRTAAFTRSEQLIHTAEREFATILEGLRMYLRAQQGLSE